MIVSVIAFDLDGVLWDSRDMHFEVLNESLAAISPEHVISRESHEKTFNGHPTRVKLEILSETACLPRHLHDSINSLKQHKTADWIEKNVSFDAGLVELFTTLRYAGYKLAVVSNAVKNTVLRFLECTGTRNLVDLVVSNEDVHASKPSPVPYLQVAHVLGVSPKNILAVEDSGVGVEAAKAACCNVLHVSCPREVTIKKIGEALACANGYGFTALNVSRDNVIVPDLNVIVPMAGRGSRFAEKGYKLPKPFIDVAGQPMIKRVVDSLGVNAMYTFLTLDNKSFLTESAMQAIVPRCITVPVESVTEGAACTVMLAETIANCDQPLLIVNSDQLVSWSYVEMVMNVHRKNADACILTFRDDNPKWSFAELSGDGYVKRVAEKDPISNVATCGIYYWRRGSDFFKFARQMIAANDRVNNEFYVCPVFNHAIAGGLKVIVHDVDEMVGLGTPEDLERYLSN